MGQLTVQNYYTTITVVLPVGTTVYSENQFSVEVTHTVNNVTQTTLYAPQGMQITNPTVSTTGLATINNVPVFSSPNSIKVRYYDNIDFSAATNVDTLGTSGTYIRTYEDLA